MKKACFNNQLTQIFIAVNAIIALVTVMIVSRVTPDYGILGPPTNQPQRDGSMPSLFLLAFPTISVVVYAACRLAVRKLAQKKAKMLLLTDQVKDHMVLPTPAFFDAISLFVAIEMLYFVLFFSGFMPFNPFVMMVVMLGGTVYVVVITVRMLRQALASGHDFLPNEFKELFRLMGKR